MEKRLLFIVSTDRLKKPFTTPGLQCEWFNQYTMEASKKMESFIPCIQNEAWKRQKDGNLKHKTRTDYIQRGFSALDLT